MSEKDKPPMGTAEAGMVAIGRAAARQPTEQEIQQGILKSMSEVVARPYNPNALRAPENVKVANAPEVTTAGEPKCGSGWQEEKPLTSPMPKCSFIEGVVGGMIDAALPPGGEKKDRK
jgi:hypothetical protein